MKFQDLEPDVVLYPEQIQRVIHERVWIVPRETLQNKSLQMTEPFEVNQQG